MDTDNNILCALYGTLKKACKLKVGALQEKFYDIQSVVNSFLVTQWMSEPLPLKGQFISEYL